MDIDVKNLIERLLTACRRVDSLKNNDGSSLEEKVIRDIHFFIRRISTADAEERIAVFDGMFIDNADVDARKSELKDKHFPEALSHICTLDKTVLKNKSINLCDIYISAFAEIGRYYSLSKYDSKDIDSSNFLAIIKSMQEYVSSQKEEKCCTTESLETKKKMTPVKQQAEEVQEDNNQADAPEETLEELMEQLNALIGLDGVKREVNSLINLLKIKKIREERGYKTADVSKHLVFLGNPGTGKTTVARLLSKIYKQLGALEKGQLIEVDRAGLVAGYVGQTALKTKEKLDEAMGGILFIDEAYTLAKGGNDFGQEAIDTILKAMEDNRDSFVVIVAGYPEPIKKFLESNPGLKSRFNKNILFEDYTEEELLEIIHSLCNKLGLHLNTDAEKAVEKYLSELCQNKPENFANGREMRNLFETAYANQANRLATLEEITDNDLNEITVEDLSI